MAKRNRNAGKKVIIEFTMTGSLETAADVIDNLLDAGAIQKIIEEEIEQDEAEFAEPRANVPRIKSSKVFIEY